MITLITGKKGSGKTKKLIDMVNTALQTTKGHVVVVEKGNALNNDIKYTARLVDAVEYKIEDYSALYGFLAGLAAGNFDITDIFVDGIFRICGDSTDAFGELLEKLAALGGDVKYTFTVSADTLDLPDSVKKFI